MPNVGVAFNRRLKGSGSVFVRKHRRLLEMKLPITGELVQTGLPDTPENRKYILDILDGAYLQHKLTGINPFEHHFRSTITIAESYTLFMQTYGASKAEKTRVGYRTAYNTLLKHIETKSATTDSITEGISEAIRGMRTARSVSIVTYLRAIRVFCNWMHKKKIIKEAVDIKYIRRENVRTDPLPLPQVYTRTECEQLIEYFKSLDYELHLFIRFLLASGFRFHEAAEFSANKIDEKFIRVNSKDNRQEERVPISATLRLVLVDMIAYRADSAIPGTDAFNDRLSNLRRGEVSFYERRMNPGKVIMPPQRDGKLFSYDDRRETYRMLRKRLDAAMVALRIVKKNRAFHEFRKTFISRLCEAKVPIDVACKIARCRVDVIMQYYRHFSEEELLGASLGTVSELCV